MEQRNLTTIRMATNKDVALLSELSAITFCETFADENTPEDMEAYLRDHFSFERLTQELADPLATFFIAELSGKPVGYAKLSSSKPYENVSGTNPIELVRLYLLSQSIGHGIGAALMQTCIQYAKSRGYKTLWLGVWEHNPRAISFYRKWGFQEVGSHIFQLGSDAQTDLIMQKILEAE